MKSRGPLPPEVVDRVAGRFRALGEPARLSLIRAMCTGEQTVSELVEETGLSQANVSRHLAVLHGAGLLTRRREGTWVHYRLADEGVLELCDMVCSRVEREVRGLREAVTGG